MPRIRVKICCIASRAEAHLALSAGADALGLVAAMPSGPGPIPDERIRQIAGAIPPPAASVLLTAETKAAAIADHAARTGVSTVQIVNHIDPGEYQTLRALLPGRRFFQVVHVEDISAVAIARDYADVTDAILLDSGRPSATIPELGGTGRTHDWSVSRSLVEAVDVPVFLAGGLNAENVGEAIRAVRPFGVDICSGVRSDDELDGDKLDAFTRSVQAAGAEV